MVDGFAVGGCLGHEEGWAGREAEALRFEGDIAYLDAWKDVRWSGDEEAVEGSVEVRADDPDVGAAAFACAGDDVCEAVPVVIAGGDPDPAAEVSAVGGGDEEGRPADVVERAETAAVDTGFRIAAGAEAVDDVVIAVAVDVAGGDADAAGEGWGVGEEEVAQEASGAGVGDDGAEIEGAEVGAAAGARAGDDVVAAVAVDIADGDVDTAGEVAVGLELGDLLFGDGVDDDDEGSETGGGAEDGIRDAIAGDIADGGGDAGIAWAGSGELVAEVSALDVGAEVESGVGLAAGDDDGGGDGTVGGVGGVEPVEGVEVEADPGVFDFSSGEAVFAGGESLDEDGAVVVGDSGGDGGSGEC